MRIAWLLSALAAGPTWATRRAEAETAAAADRIGSRLASSSAAAPFPYSKGSTAAPFPYSNGSTAAVGGTGSVNGTADVNGTGPAAAIMVPINYTFSVFNSDCPCKRTHLRYCTWFRRQRVRDGRCYPISHYAHSMRVLDPLVSERNRLSCRIYTGFRCDGVGFELTFVDNTRCREPRQFVGGDSPGYRSFVCNHATG